MIQFLDILKTLALTFLVVLLLQFRVGDQTLEQRTYQFLTRSDFSMELRGAAKGAIRMAEDGYKKARIYLASVINDLK